MARRYRRRGLDPTARLLFDELRGKGSTVLEIGGGVGEIEIELLRAGADRATNVELTPVYDNEAEQLLREASLEGRAERRYGDIVSEPSLAEAADVVVMHRVVCCYPDMPALVGAAADKAHRALALSFPRDTWWMRLFARGFNAWRKVRRDEFRFFVHPPSGILATAGAHGLHVTRAHEGRIWQIAALERR
jgi:magnesium-protoporphyrin O-methyltransferase